MGILEQIEDLQSSNKILVARIQRIEELRSKLESPGGLDYSKDPVKTSPQDLLAKSISELVDMQTELATEAIERQKKIDSLMAELEKFPPEEKEILFYRSDGWSYQRIADELYRAKSTIFRTVQKIKERNDASRRDAGT